MATNNLLFPLVISLALALGCAAGCGSGPKWNILQDTDFDTCDLPDQSKITSSIDECAKLCLSVNDCAAASWNGPDSHYHDNNCNLKKCSTSKPGPGMVGVTVDRGDLPAGMPQEWCEKYQNSDLLYTGDEGGVKYRPEVGNGFVATVVGSDTMCAAGVFNGIAVSENPTHRARIPAPLALAVDGLDVTGAALDLRGGAYVRLYGEVQLRFYAHRARRSLMVVDVSAPGGSSPVVNLKGFGGQDASSDDFNFQSSQKTIAGSSVIVWNGETKEAETPEYGTIKVSVVFSAEPSEGVTAPASGCKAFIAAVRTSLEAEDPEAAALDDWESASKLPCEELYAEHEAGWAELWESGMEISGPKEIARVVNSSQYFLLSSLRADAPYSTSPGGLAHGVTHTGYLGHTFWDAETWMYPSMVLWHPDIAASMLQYRLDRVPEAEKKAGGYNKGWKGAMFAWESAASGAETCPTQYPEGELEQHITGDVAIAAQQLWYASHNRTWLKKAYQGLAKKTADFWASRVEWDGTIANINKVIPPDEQADDGNDNSVFTNYVAKANLLFAIESSGELGETVDDSWKKTADGIQILFDDAQGIHPEFSGYNGVEIKQADVVLLGYPLMMEMPKEVRKKDVDYYAAKTNPDAPCMSWGMYVVGYLDSGDLESANANFGKAWANAKEPFNVWTEYPDHGCVSFLTGQGGFLQLMLFGIGGLRIWKDHLSLNPQLIAGIDSFVVRGIHYRHAIFELAVTADDMTLRLVSPSSIDAKLKDSSGKSHKVTTEGVILPRGKAKLYVEAKDGIATETLVAQEKLEQQKFLERAAPAKHNLGPRAMAGCLVVGAVAMMAALTAAYRRVDKQGVHVPLVQVPTTAQSPLSPPVE